MSLRVKNVHTLKKVQALLAEVVILLDGEWHWFKTTAEILKAHVDSALSDYDQLPKKGEEE